MWKPRTMRCAASSAHLAAEKLVRDYATFLGGSAPRFYYNVNPQQPASNYGQLLVKTRAEEGKHGPGAWVAHRRLASVRSGGLRHH